ncbi:MAG: hypothetical protein KDA53_01745 [Hyphomonas sp.]|nr:hypothetical protein [Hyphomonas sp.]
MFDNLIDRGETEEQIAEAAKRAARGRDDFEAMPFRARLMARQGNRPQSTLAIDSGISHRAQTGGVGDAARQASAAARDAIEQRRAEDLRREAARKAAQEQEAEQARAAALARQQELDAARAREAEAEAARVRAAEAEAVRVREAEAEAARVREAEAARIREQELEAARIREAEAARVREAEAEAARRSAETAAAVLAAQPADAPDTDELSLKDLMDDVAAHAAERAEAEAAEVAAAEAAEPILVAEPTPVRDADETPEEVQAYAAAVPMAAPSGKTGWGLFGGGHDDDDSDWMDEEEDEAPVGVATRIGDISQFAFAGLAVLGLAGLSVMAAESALNGPRTEGLKPNTPVPGPTNVGGASTVAIAAAAPEEIAPAPWFNYQGVADMLAARKAEIDAAEEAARLAAEEQAKIQAANAIAEAEARRLAEEAEAAAAAAEQERIAEELERQRLADLEAERIAAIEAQKLADAEALRQAEADAEAKRLADLEAKRKAEADAEAKRLADLEAQRLAKLEADRKAAEEAARQEAFAEAKAAEAERLRLANLQAEKDAKAVADRLAAQKAAADKAAADRLAAQQAAAAKAEAARLEGEKRFVIATTETPAVAPAGPKPIVFEPYTGTVPQPASVKPAKPAIPVTRVAPPSMSIATTTVRPFDSGADISPQAPQDFLAGRVERHAAGIQQAELDAMKDEFTALLTYGEDGRRQPLAVSSGPALSVVFERTYTREVMKSSIRTIRYTPGEEDDVTRLFSEPAPVRVSIMCRDVAYAFAGVERGRFAACEAPGGEGWRLARASDGVAAGTVTAAP